MLTIAVTGGVACGKTSVCERFQRGFGPSRISFFSCDAEVSVILEISDILGVLREWGKEFDADLVSGGHLVRATMRELLFENLEFRERVEGLVHPLVLERLDVHLADQPDSIRISLIEVPLLYESNFPVVRDLDLVVAASGETQMRSLCVDRGLDLLLAKRMIQAQLPMKQKMEKGELVVWNDGSRNSLDCQTDHLIARCDKILN